MVGLLRSLHERKRWLLLVVAIYCVLCHLAYKRLWKNGGAAVRSSGSGLVKTVGDNVDELLSSLWNSLPSSTLSGVVIEGPLPDSARAEPLIAVGSGITSRKLKGVIAENMGEKFQFFHTFLPTFCNTASPHYLYRFYLGYDRNDPVFSDALLRDAFHRQFTAATTSSTETICKKRGIKTELSLVWCDHAGKPTWAQNDAMMDAYLDHVDYYYRVNDDTKMLTGGWTELFIAALEGYDPPRVGVVGPNHSGGNVGILTYDFVHRTHVDILGYYYPHLFSDWWGDTWITRVYKPNRSTKIGKVRLAHTLGLGQRYGVNWNVKNHLGEQLDRDVKVINRYIEAVKSNRVSGVKQDGRKVISMSLYGKDLRYTWGVIRNAQQVSVYLPEWTLRVYVAADPAPTELAVPPRIINKLRLLGAEVAYVSATGNIMAPRDWRLLAADDQRLDYFLVRDADSRLSDREASAVRDWVSTAEKNGPRSGVVHCVRDHPKHADRAIVDGLWGGRPRSLRQLLRQNISRMMMTGEISGFASNSSSSISSQNETTSTGGNVAALLDRVLWPAVGNWSYCHDSVSPCDRWTSHRPFPRARQGREYVGEKFDAYQELVSSDSAQLTTDVVCGSVGLNLTAITASTTVFNHTVVPAVGQR